MSIDNTLQIAVASVLSKGLQAAATNFADNGASVSQLVSAFGREMTATTLSGIAVRTAVNMINDHINSQTGPAQLQDQACQCLAENTPAAEGNEIEAAAAGTSAESVAQQVGEAVANEVIGGGGSVDEFAGHKLASEGLQKAESEKEGESQTGGGKGNWLMALADGLAKIQSKFIGAAVGNLATMDTLSNEMVSLKKDSPEATQNRDKFLMAQSEFQANIQMFNMMANMTATSLKTLGEGLTSIARKQ